MKAWELLDGPEKWTQGEGARDENGVPVYYNAKNAVCWCLMGALAKCYGSLTPDWYAAVDKVNDALTQKHKNILVIKWNDDPNRTWQEVHDLLKELDI